MLAGAENLPYLMAWPTNGKFVWPCTQKEKKQSDAQKDLEQMRAHPYHFFLLRLRYYYPWFPTRNVPHL